MLNSYYTTPSNSRVINANYSQNSNNRTYETIPKCTCDNKYTLLTGRVTLENGASVQGAIILLESINSCSCAKEIYSATTNVYGEFCFMIYNTNIDYKLKIFNNE